jgi:chorismate mutase-like protein
MPESPSRNISNSDASTPKSANSTESALPHVSPELAALRARIDELDRRLVEVLAERLDVCNEVARLKEKSDTAIIQPQRVRDVLTGRRQWAIDRSMDPDFIEQIMRVVLAETHRIEVAGRRSDGAPDKLASSNNTRSTIDTAMDTVATRIDHIVVAVEDLDVAVRGFADRLGFHLVPMTPQPAGIAVIAAGGVTLVLVGPTAGAEVEAHLAVHGSGIHHVAIEVLNAGYAHATLSMPDSDITPVIVDELGHEQFFTVRDPESGTRFGYIARTGHRHGVAITNILEAFRHGPAS